MNTPRSIKRLGASLLIGGQAVAATLAPVLRRATAGMLTAAYPGAEALFRAV